MLGLVRRISILLGFLAFPAWLSVGCAYSVIVDVDEREDFSHYQTWDWMPQIRHKVVAPHGSAPELDARVAGLIEASLRSQGFERTSDRPDFYLTYFLTVQRRTEVVQQAVAPYLLSSLDSSPSYWIEGSVSVTRHYDYFRLAIGISEGRGRMTWRAALVSRVVAETELPLDDAVGILFDRFPPYDSAEATRR